MAALPSANKRAFSAYPQIRRKHPSEREREQLAANKTGVGTLFTFLLELFQFLLFVSTLSSEGQE